MNIDIINSFRFKVFIFWLHIKGSFYIFLKTPWHKKVRLFSFVMGLWVLGLFNWNLASILRSAYFWFRQADDVIDGDLQHNQDIETFRKLKKELLENMHEPKNLRRAYFEQIDWLILNAYYGCLKIGQDNQQSMITIFEGLEYDIERVEQNKRFCSAAEIREYFDKIDIPLVLMTLQFVDERAITFDDLRSLIDATRTRYNIRDFIPDLKIGFINISIEDINKYRINIENCRDAKSLKEAVQYAPFKQWFSDQLIYIQQKLDDGKLMVKIKPIRFRTWLTLQLAFIRPCNKNLKEWKNLF